MLPASNLTDMYHNHSEASVPLQSEPLWTCVAKNHQEPIYISRQYNHIFHM